jgi:hypothetical protein
VDLLTFDLETSTGAIHKRKASPFHPTNYVVASGFKLNDGPPCGSYYTSKEASLREYKMPLDGVDLLVGFNIKFDLLWSWHRTSSRDTDSTPRWRAWTV